MVTQFGYITVWSIVWPIAPVFAFINNYIELRSDALKICKHVRQPIGDRVETIGSWLDTMVSTHYLSALRRRLLADRAQSIISWIGAVTNATLIYLFRPGFELHDHDHPSPHLQSHGSAHLATIVSAYSSTHSTRALLPTLIPLGLVALAASHGWFVLRWIVDAVAERTLWRGSPEEVEVQRMTASSSKRVERGEDSWRVLEWRGGRGEGDRESGQGRVSRLSSASQPGSTGRESRRSIQLITTALKHDEMNIETYFP
jgi:anoctamin-10